MKRLFPFFLILTACQTTQPEKKPISVADSPVISVPIKTYFYFGAITYTYDEIMQGRSWATMVSNVIESPYMNDDNKFKLLDKLATSIYKSNYSIEDRTVYGFNTYSEASIKRQDVLKNGIK